MRMRLNVRAGADVGKRLDFGRSSIPTTTTLLICHLVRDKHAFDGKGAQANLSPLAPQCALYVKDAVDDLDLLDASSS